MILCARATRGRGLPSLDARTLGTAKPPLQLLREGGLMDAPSVIDRDTPEKVQCPYFITSVPRIGFL